MAKEAKKAFVLSLESRPPLAWAVNWHPTAFIDSEGGGGDLVSFDGKAFLEEPSLKTKANTCTSHSHKTLISPWQGKGANKKGVNEMSESANNFGVI